MRAFPLIALLALPACGGAVDPDDDGHWVSAPASTKAASTGARAFVMRAIDLGEGEGWTSIGYDLDALNSPADEERCVHNARSTALDGHFGIDNSFGHVVMPYLEAIEGHIAKRASERIELGAPTLLLDLQGFPADSNADTLAITGKASLVRPAEGSANFSKNGEWVPDEGTGALGEIRGGYVNHGTWVSGEPSDIPFAFTYLSAPLRLTIHQATITADLDENGVPSRMVLAGILDPTELLATLRHNATKILTSELLCSPPKGTLIIDYSRLVEEARDISASQRDDGRCDGISFGVAFVPVETRPLHGSPLIGVPPRDPCLL